MLPYIDYLPNIHQSNGIKAKTEWLIDLSKPNYIYTIEYDFIEKTLYTRLPVITRWFPLRLIFYSSKRFFLTSLFLSKYWLIGHWSRYLLVKPESQTSNKKGLSTSLKHSSNFIVIQECIPWNWILKVKYHSGATPMDLRAYETTSVL